MLNINICTTEQVSMVEKMLTKNYKYNGTKYNVTISGVITP